MAAHPDATGLGMTMPMVTLNLRPILWAQGVEHHTSIGVEGRRFSVECTVDAGSALRLSNKMRLEELRAHIQIFETGRMGDELAKLGQPALGSFHFVNEKPKEPLLLGWFVLNVRSFEDVWVEVGRGGYSESMMMIKVGPLEQTSKGDWLWDVATSPHLIIDAVSVSFRRVPPHEPEPAKRSRSFFWRR
jgi:hypothetical protein